MPNLCMIGVHPADGRVALGQVACKQLGDRAVIDRIYPSQLPYRALLMDTAVPWTYRLAPVSELRPGEEVVHAHPFAGKRGRWPRPLWPRELPSDGREG